MIRRSHKPKYRFTCPQRSEPPIGIGERRLQRPSQVNVFVVVLLGVALLRMPTLAVAQQSSDDVLMLSGGVPLVRLLDLCAEKLDLDVEYDRAQVTGDVQLRLSQPTDAESLWALTNAVLASRGLTTIRRPGTKIVAVVQTRVAGGAAPIELIESTQNTSAAFRSVVIDSESTPPSRLLSALSVLASPDGRVVAVGDTSLILLADRSDRIQTMLDVATGLADPEREVVAERVELRHRDAEALTTALNGVLAAQLQAGAAPRRGSVTPTGDRNALVIVAPRDSITEWIETIQSLDTPERIQTETYTVPWLNAADLASNLEMIGRIQTGTPSGSNTGWQVVADSLTNSVFVTANVPEHQRIAAWIDSVLQRGAPSSSRVHVVRVRHRAAAALAELIEATNSPPEVVTAPAIADSTVDNGQPTTPASISTERPGTAADVEVSVDEPTNSLVVTGTPLQIQRIVNLVELLDVRQSQVLLEFTLLSLNESDTRDLGVELQYLVDDAGTLFRLSSLFGLTDIVPDNTSTSVEASGGTAVVLDPSDYSAVIRALETVSKGRSLIRPQLLVGNNEEASLDSVEQQPFISTNASDTVATTSFGGTQDAGTNVSVQPQITAGDELTIRYSVSLSTFIGESADPALPPPSQQSTVSSVATIPDGYAIAVGGIASEVEGEAVSQVPILGDIPLVGELFRSRSQSRSSSKFFVLIRARIMRDVGFEDLKFLGDLTADTLGLDDDLPQVEPRIIR